MFAGILVGRGIDFAFHLNAVFSDALAKGEPVKDALKTMYRTAGPGVVTGALTTAAAFPALLFTGLDAMEELGAVLGAGDCFTMISALTVLPALYVIHHRISARLRKGKPAAPKPVYLSFNLLGTFRTFVRNRPWKVFVLFLVATVAVGLAVRNAVFEPDMLEIEPPDMKSVALHRDIIQKFELHPDFAMVTSDSLDKTRELVKQLKKNRLVGRVETVSEFVASGQEQKRRAPII